MPHHFLRLRNPGDAKVAILGTTLRTFPSCTKLATKPGEMDEWEITVGRADGPTPTGGVQAFTYKTGTGLRATSKWGFRPTRDCFVRLPHRATVHQWDASVPMEPSAKDLMTSLGFDVSTALELPHDDMAAMDYIQDERVSDGKASEVLRMVRDLRLTLDKVKALLRGTGITLEDFVDACREMDQ